VSLRINRINIRKKYGVRNLGFEQNNGRLIKWNVGNKKKKTLMLYSFSFILKMFMAYTIIFPNKLPPAYKGEDL
jgi:hypothetical protein